MGKRAHTTGATASDLARDPHNVAHNGDARRFRTRATAIVEGVFAILTPDPDSVVSTLYMSKDRVLRDQAWPDRKQQTFLRLPSHTEKPNRMLQLMRILEIDRHNAPD